MNEYNLYLGDFIVGTARGVEKRGKALTAQIVEANNVFYFGFPNDDITNRPYENLYIEKDGKRYYVRSTYFEYYDDVDPFTGEKENRFIARLLYLVESH